MRTRRHDPRGAGLGGAVPPGRRGAARGLGEAGRAGDRGSHVIRRAHLYSQVRGSPPSGNTELLGFRVARRVHWCPPTMRVFAFLGCLLSGLAAFSATAAAQDDAWAREAALSAGLGYATPAGTFAAELEWRPMPILALAGSLGTDGSGANGAAALRFQIPADSLAVGIALGGAIDALTFTGPEATTELHLAWRDGDGL